MRNYLGFALILLTCTVGYGDPFRNLGFDEVDTNKIVFSPDNPAPFNGGGAIADLLPGWEIVAGTNQYSFMGYQITLDTSPAPPPYSSAYLFGPDLTNRVNFPVEGGYALMVRGNLEAVSLIQRGDIPPGARWLRYSYAHTPFDVSINGEKLPMSFAFCSICSFVRSDVEFNISAYAGQNVELKLTMIDLTQFGEPNSYNRFDKLDSIRFVVPEPLFVGNDFNGDGATDVVFEHQDGSIGVWFMNNGPELISASFFNPKAVADPRWHIVGNKTDLLFQHEDGTLAVWSMNGTNLVSGVLLNPSQPGEDWKVAGTGDMNHDGKNDILFQHTDGTLAVWFMDGINLVQGALLNPTKPGDSGWRVVGTAALSSAGNTDLIFQRTDGTLAAWYMDGINLVRGVLLNPSSPGGEGWRVATTLDLNGDGKTDLLFQHHDGTVAVWLMDGINLIAGQLLNPEDPGTGWRIAGPR